MNEQHLLLKRVDFIFVHNADWEKILQKTIHRPKQDLINELISSELKGRGGAGFPTGLKWKQTSEAERTEKYVICNADEGEPGTFKDREILTRVPYKVLTAMAVCGFIVGAKCGIIYLRGEYKFLEKPLNEAINEFSYFCKKINLNFSIRIFMGSGAYICGEETALFESLEGKGGEPRNKPPYPSICGFRNQPTVIINVETLAHTYTIFKYGAKKFYDLGVQYSRGSKLFSISGDTPKPGIYELELGMSLEDFIDEFGDGDTKAVQVGGASGFLVPRKKFRETAIGYQGKLIGISLPTGGVMEAALRTVYEIVTGREIPFKNLQVLPIRSMDGVKMCTIKIEAPLEAWNFLDNVELKCAVAHGLTNAKKATDSVKNGTADFHFLEVMACPGGCLGGGGQPIPTNAEIRKKRATAIYAEDMRKPILKSHENPEVIKIYTDFLGKPSGDLSHKLLHTTYQIRERT